MHYLNIFWQLARPRTLVVIWLHFLLIYLYIAADVPSVTDLLIVFAVMAASYINAACINDLADVETDKINLPKQNQAADRPMINGSAQQRDMRIIMWISAAVTIVGSAVVVPWLAIIGLLVIGFNTIYSLSPIKLSGRGALAQYTLPLMYVGYPAFLAIGAANTTGESFIVWLIAGLYMLFVGRLFLKDIRDEEGDRATHKRTVVVRRGVAYSIKMSAVWQIIGLLTMLAALSFSGHAHELYMAASVISIAGIVWALSRCSKVNQLEERLLWVATAGRFASMWVFICVLLGVIASADTNVKHTFTLLSMALFLAGVGMLYEEILSVRRRASRESS